MHTQLTSDKYFQKGHWPLKIWQTALALIAWAIILFPLCWILLPLCAPQAATAIGIPHYQDELDLLKFLGKFFGGGIILITVCNIAMTLWNNRHFPRNLSTSNDTKTALRRAHAQIIERDWEERFGSCDHRQQVRFYQVSTQQNLDNSLIKKLFKEDEGRK